MTTQDRGPPYWHLGPVPEDWLACHLGGHCQINAATVRKGEIEGEIEYVDISSVAVGRLSAVQRLLFAAAPSRARRRVRHGDTIGSCVRPNHRSYLVMHSPQGNLIVSTGFAVLSPTEFGPSFLHQLTTQPEFVDFLCC
jgi:type I restriction enzyme, S subunit